LRLKYGWSGEGKFWALNNIIGDADGCRLSTGVGAKTKAIASELDFTVDELREFVRYLTEECELVIECDGYITTEITQQCLEEVTQKREYQRQWKKEKSNSKIGNSNSNSEKSNIEKEQSKVNESKVNNTKENDTGLPSANLAPLQKKYGELDKDKHTISAFIRQESPLFAEPYVDLWNLFAGEKKLPLVQKINGARRRKFAARIKESAFDFLAILKKAATSDFLLSGSWFCFDWIFENQTNYQKILEGNYDRSGAIIKAIHEAQPAKKKTGHSGL